MSPRRKIAMVDDHFPIVLLDMGSSGRTEDEFRKFFETSRAIRQRATREKTRYVSIVMTEALLDARERKLIAEYSNSLPAEHMAGYIGCVLIIPNGVLRGIITALTWVIPRLPPLAGVRTAEEAVQTATDMLKKSQIRYTDDQARGAAMWLRARSAGEVPGAKTSEH